jgi:hyperosmotically inducible protein
MNNLGKPHFGQACSALLIVGILLSGCTTIMMETGKKAFEDRTTEEQVTDTKIATGILKRLADRDKSLLLDVNVDIWEQRALLTGTLDDPEEKQAVVDLVKSDSRITKIHNDIQIVTKEEKEARRKQVEEGNKDSKEGIGQTVDDIWINTKIEAQLIATKGVTSVNYRWRSVRNNVSVIGRAPSTTELTKVLDIIKATKGVELVKDYVQIKPLHP